MAQRALSESSLSGTWAIVVIISVVSIGHLPVAEGCGRGSAYIEKNGYRQILIAIGDDVPEDTSLLNRTQYVFTRTSAFLYEITKKRAFFEEIIVLIPQTWSDKSAYDPATYHTIQVSNIVIDRKDANQEEGDEPFVIQAAGCGQPGCYMQLTPEYLMDDRIAEQYGPYEKVIVHQWAHLRYGVFGEYPEDQAFYAEEGGVIEATRCSKALKGKPFDKGNENGICDIENDLYGKSCQFKADDDLPGKYGSLMYSHKLDHVAWFCENDTNSPNTLHNRQAPNAQNQICDGRSVWEILRSHPDFADGANLPRDVLSTQPKFRLVRHRSKRTVFVLDTSGSMNDNDLIGKMAQAVKNFIQSLVVDGEMLGMVRFNGTATIKPYLKEVKPSTREGLLSKIPMRASGWTSIGAGLQKGIKVLSHGGEDPAGGVIVVVTDGEENRKPLIAEVQDEIFRKQIIVNSITVTKAADEKIEMLVKATQGLTYFFSNALNEAMVSMAARGTGIENRPMQLYSRSVKINQSNSHRDSVVIDSSIGRKTEFLIGHSSQNITIEVTTPSGRTISRNDPEYTTDTEFNSTQIRIFGVAERGRWKLGLQSPNSTEQSVRITVLSRVIDQSNPIVTTATWAKKIVQFPDERQILYVSVSQGLSPLRHANVTAILERPGDGNETAPPIQLTVRDNGAGADIRKGDGIYSSYVTNYTDNGRYYVKVKVTNSPLSVVMKNRIVGTGGSRASGRKRNRRDTGPRQPAEEFQRVVSAGSFQLQNFTEGVDAFPPGKVTDLRVSVDDGTAEVTLSWTATGADLDQGTVSSYVLWESKDFETIYSNHWNATRVEVNMKPQTAGMEESYTIQVNETGSVTYYFALEAQDNSGNISPRSNVVSVSMKYLNNPSSGVRNPSSSSVLNLPLIIGCVVGSIVLTALVIVGIIVYKQKKKTYKVNNAAELQ